MTTTYIPGVNATSTSFRLGAGELEVILGAPNRTSVNGAQLVWALDAATAEGVGHAVGSERFTGWATYDISVMVANASTGTGDHVMRYTAADRASGESLAAATDQADVTTTAGSQNIIQTVALASGLAAPAAGEMLGFRVARVSNVAGDTLPNDLYLYAVIFKKAS